MTRTKGSWSGKKRSLCNLALQELITTGTLWLEYVFVCKASRTVVFISESPRIGEVLAPKIAVIPAREQTPVEWFAEFTSV